jgi:hypothetical protein
MFKNIGIVLAVALMALMIMDTRICLEADTVGGDIGPAAGRLSSCVGARLDRQQEQARQWLGERLVPASPLPASP